MGVSILADERADDLSAVIYPISGRAIWNRVWYIDGEYLTT